MWRNLLGNINKHIYIYFKIEEVYILKTNYLLDPDEFYYVLYYLFFKIFKSIFKMALYIFYIILNVNILLTFKITPCLT